MLLKREKFAATILSLISFSCGPQPIEECRVPERSFTDCCSENGGPYICDNERGHYLFSDDHLVCSDEHVTSSSACKRD